MKKLRYILFALIIFLIPLTCVEANYKPTTIKNKEDLVYFIRYYNGSQSTVKKKIVKLEKDLILENNYINFNLSKSFTFDLNGHKIINKKNKPCIVINGDKHLLKIINSKKEGYLKSNQNTIKTISGNLIINNIKIISNSPSHNALYIDGGKTKILNGKIISKGNAITVNYGYLQTDKGTFKGYDYGLNINNGKAIVNGGTFKGHKAGLKLNNYKSLHLKNANFVTIEQNRTTIKNKVSIPKSMINNLYSIKYIILHNKSNF